MQNRRLDEEALAFSEPNGLEQVYEKRRLEAPEMAKKTLLSLPSNAQLVSNFVKKYQRLAVEGGLDDYLFLMNAPKLLFSDA